MKCFTAMLLAFCSYYALADHSCPDEERPYPRGGSACDSCDWESELERYREGELSTTRASTVFDHDIRVTVFCDGGRPVDVDDVFSNLAAAETVFGELLGRAVDREDGVDRPDDPEEDAVPHALEIVIGICDVGDGVDDCAMYELCRSGIGDGCDPVSGQAFRDTVAANGSAHTAFVPWLPEEAFWWVEGNRYGNLQHEFAHLLDFQYIRKHSRRGANTNWWVEGLAQYVQWSILEDDLSWDRGNGSATMLDVFTYARNVRDYYDGMRMFAFLAEYDAWLLEKLAEIVKSGVYDSPERHLYWHDNTGLAAWRHQRSWEYWNSTMQDERNERVMVEPGFTTGFLETQRAR